MAFERAKITVSASATVGTGIKVTLRKRQSPASMIFSVRGDIAKRLGWEDGDKLEVLIGTGGDHGLMRLRKNNSAGDAHVRYRKAMKAITYASITLGHQAAFVDRAEAGRWCQHEEVDDGYLEIVLPKWADETAPKRAAAAQPAAAAPLTPVARPLMQTPSKSVTASIMGDPPPGRREMLAKVGDLKA